MPRRAPTKPLHIMDPILKLLSNNAKYTPTDIAAMLGLDAADVAQKIQEWEQDGTILGYQAILDPERTGRRLVMALIEVRITPERGGGFDRVARRIARFDQVQSCWLMSGSYDLAVVVVGNDLHEVAHFVAEKLSPLEGVLSTATHFHLKTYKQNGLMAHEPQTDGRLAVAP